jgi:hypothetical protein
MGIFTYDAVTIVQDLITNKWKDIRPPRVSAIWDKRSVGFMDDRRDELIIYPKNEVVNYFGIGGQAFWHDQQLELEIRTFRDIKRHNEVVKKVATIIKENITGTGYADLRVVSSFSKNYLYRNMYSYILTLSIRKADP